MYFKITAHHIKHAQSMQKQYTVVMEE